MILTIIDYICTRVNTKAYNINQIIKHMTIVDAALISMKKRNRNGLSLLSRIKMSKDLSLITTWNSLSRTSPLCIPLILLWPSNGTFKWIHCAFKERSNNIISYSL